MILAFEVIRLVSRLPFDVAAHARILGLGAVGLSAEKPVNGIL